MKKTKRAALDAHGWRVGSVADSLELSPAEAAFVETKLALSRSLRDRRTANRTPNKSPNKTIDASRIRA